jgi:hypothetical protein
MAGRKELLDENGIEDEDSLIQNGKKKTRQGVDLELLLEERRSCWI